MDSENHGVSQEVNTHFMERKSGGSMNKERLKPDTVMKEYWRRNSEFADLFNAVLFQGRRILQPEGLEERDSEASRALEIGENILTEESARDIFKIVKRAGGVEYALLGLENQEGIHYAMPLRALAYDVYAYNQQYAILRERHKASGELQGDEYISRMKRTDRFLPVVTIVIYYGDKPWDGPLCLHDMLELPSELQDYVADYRLNLIEARDNRLVLHNTNNIDLFALLRIIYDKSVPGRERRNAVRQYEEEHSIDKSVVMAIAATSKIDLQKYNKKGETAMCSLFDELMEEGRIEGREEGKIIAYYEMNLTTKEIAGKMRLPEEKVREVIAEQGK